MHPEEQKKNEIVHQRWIIQFLKLHAKRCDDIIEVIMKKMHKYGKLNWIIWNNSSFEAYGNRII